MHVMSREALFPNLAAVQNSISHLYSKLGVGFVESFRDEFAPDPSHSRYKGDVILATHRLASDITSHLRVPATTVVVAYSRALDVPGRVELSATSEILVELHEEYRFNFNAVAGILAHEIAHIVLHRACIELPSTMDNEILTDTTAALFGLAIPILNGTVDETEFNASYTLTRYRHFGYITPAEFGYLLAKRDDLFQRDSSSALRLAKLGEAYRNGRQQLQRERCRRPFRPRSLYQRLLTAFARRDSSAPSKPLVFQCSRCCKKLRVPQLHAELSVRCPVCGASHRCYS
jgi:DNA-directed RNA polymerase subunit RPC12/RpoP